MILEKVYIYLLILSGFEHLYSSFQEMFHVLQYSVYTLKISCNVYQV